MATGHAPETPDPLSRFPTPTALSEAPPPGFRHPREEPADTLLSHQEAGSHQRARAGGHSDVPVQDALLASRMTFNIRCGPHTRQAQRLGPSTVAQLLQVGKAAAGSVIAGPSGGPISTAGAVWPSPSTDTARVPSPAWATLKARRAVFALNTGCSSVVARAESGRGRQARPPGQRNRRVVRLCARRVGRERPDRTVEDELGQRHEEVAVDRSGKVAVLGGELVVCLRG